MSGLSIVFLGLSLTSSWGNGHATTYRALLKGLARRGHRVLFLERDVPWYAMHRDLPAPPFGTFPSPPAPPTEVPSLHWFVTWSPPSSFVSGPGVPSRSLHASFRLSNS